MQDTVRKYIELHCISNPLATIKLVDFVGGFNAWTIREGRKPQPRFAIVAALEAMGLPIGRKSNRLRVGGISFIRPGLVVLDGKLVSSYP